LRPLAIDISRIWLAASRPTPRGIERVDLALTQQLCEHWTGELYGLMPWGMRICDREALLALTAHVSAVWRDEAPPERDPSYMALREWLAGRAAFVPERRVAPARHHLRKVKRVFSALGVSGLIGSRSASRLPQGTIIACFGHLGLASSRFRAFLDRRRDITTASLIHDVVSLTDPQFFPPRNEPYFRKLLAQAGAEGNLLLTTTDHVRRQMTALPDADRPKAEATTVDISGAFDRLPEPIDDPDLASARYFVICGTREPRKNHMLLLNIWRTIASGKEAPPKLILVGGVGWGSELVDGMLTRCEPLAGHVVHVTDLGSPGLFRLMGQAAAVLSPSFDEGYGLPVEEALAMGVPVVAADTPAYREITHGKATLLNPLDGPGWRQAILALADSGPRDASTRRLAAEEFSRAKTRHPDVMARLLAI
jgi:glycosyltransferase involved in cell wall biosynthesis